MEYIRITRENIDREHICCAMSNKQSDLKKEWMKERLDEGMVFYRSVERGKCFIEYMPIEKAWAPVEGENMMFINCLWVSGSFKGHGYSNDLLNECIRDSKEKGMDGIAIISSSPKKREFMSDPKYLEKKGFKIVDSIDLGYTLCFLPLKENANPPRFKENAKRHEIEEKGIVIYYSYQCPFAYYWANRIKDFGNENGIDIKTIHVSDLESARNIPSPWSTYSLFIDGKFVTHSIQNEKGFMSKLEKSK